MRHDLLHDAELEAVREAHRSEHAPRELRQRLIERLAQPSTPTLSRAGLERLPRSGLSQARQVWALVGAAALASCLWLLLGPIEQLAERVQTRMTLGPEPAAPERVEPSGPEPAPAPPAPLARPCPLQELPPGAFYEERPSLSVHTRPGTSWQTLQMQTPSCGPLARYYMQLLSAKPVPKDPAPVLILIPDSGMNLDDLWVDKTRWYFDELANDRRAIVILAQAGPGRWKNGNRYGLGGWQTDDGANPQVDDAAYLRRVVDDMAARGVITGGNPVYLFGHAGGAALALKLAAAHPELYSGVAAFKPSRLDLPLPRPTRGSRLARVMFIADTTDVWAPTLNGIAARWAEALGVPARVAHQPPKTLPAGAAGIQRFDFGTPASQAPGVRVLTLPPGADLFPPPGGGEPLALAASRARPGFVNGAQEVWGFLDP
jgi:pimeloyl-ACP methyl ester carboxylesterase